MLYVLHGFAFSFTLRFYNLVLGYTIGKHYTFSNTAFNVFTSPCFIQNRLLSDLQLIHLISSYFWLPCSLICSSFDSPWMLFWSRTNSTNSSAKCKSNSKTSEWKPATSDKKRTSEQQAVELMAGSTCATPSPAARSVLQTVSLRRSFHLSALKCTFFPSQGSNSTACFICPPRVRLRTRNLMCLGVRASWPFTQACSESSTFAKE